ncbi:MAG: hypothetical protein ACRDOL_34250 [Streptosporangiaceae bacterium]
MEAPARVRRRAGNRRTGLSLSCLPMQVVLVFYREAWCPYWDLAPATCQTVLLPQLTDRGVALVAVSPQTPDGSLSTQEKRS